ncbi:MAG: beta-L-arabinofuranosidase domain-containing protein [Roseburia sp.]
MKKRILGFVMVLTMLVMELGVAKMDVRAEENLEEKKVLELSFEENLEDTSGTENHGTLNKEATYGEGVSGKALFFDGETYLDLGNSTTLQPENLTFSVWVKADENLSGEHMIAWMKPSGNYQGKGWYLSCLDDNTPLKLSVGESSGQPMECYVSGKRSEFFPVGEWVHIAVTYNSDAQVAAIYRNGVAQEVLYLNTASIIEQDESSEKYLGFNSPGYNGGFAKMWMDECKIYSAVATPAEVLEMYTAYGAEFDENAVLESDYNSLKFSLTTVNSDVTLPKEGAAGSTISWCSSDEEHLSSDGKVTRPKEGEEDAEVTLTATLSYGEEKKEKEFQVTVEAVSAYTSLEAFDLSEVTLLDEYESNAFSLEVDYLKSLDADRLLLGFREIAGISSDAEYYGGWEDTAIKGHTLGHYLTALSLAYEASGDGELLEIITYIVDTLAECQSDSGYLAAIPEIHYDRIEAGNTSGTWVPWYTMHKVLSGLLQAYESVGNEKALEVADKLGDWVYSRTSNWTEEVQAMVLSVEYGGMNDCLYQLYSYTGKEEHLEAAHSFDEMELFESLYQGEDVLNGLHANTTIPKILGALKRYQTLGESESYYLQVAENFWDIVIHHHSYVTGGNSEWEHFGEADVLDAERTEFNCETCNAYNMLKLSRALYQITGNHKYADYYENTFLNDILASQNPETGMTTYFQPMATGYFKVYSTAYDNFWCCTGTGMESFSKLNDSIYFKGEEELYVVQYVDSSVYWKEKNLTLTQASDIPDGENTSFEISLDGEESVNATLVFRVPDWCVREAGICINGEKQNVEEKRGYLAITADWKTGDTIELTFPMEVVAYTLPDEENVIAFKYGPVVLAANMGSDDMETGTTGVNVNVATIGDSTSSTIAIERGTVEEWLATLNENVVKSEDGLEFTLENTDCTYVFTPYYLTYENRYGIYFSLTDSSMEQTEDEEDAYETVDSLPIANDQYEWSHGLEAENSSTGTFDGLKYRDAGEGGYFSYEMKVDGTATNYLSVKYYSGDAGRTFRIYVDDEILEEVTLEDENPGDFYEKLYEIPTALTEAKERAVIKFETVGNSFAGGIFDRISILKEKEKQTEEIDDTEEMTETEKKSGGLNKGLCIVGIVAVVIGVGAFVGSAFRKMRKRKE